MGSIATFVSIGEMYKVGDWARDYTWNIRFTGEMLMVPPTFADWFPATDVSLGISNIENHEFSAGIGSLSVPKSLGSETLSITLLDDYKLQMAEWIYNWRYSVINYSKGCVTPLKDACGRCEITAFDSKGYNQYIGAYYVFPTGELTFERSSSGDVPQFQAEFVVAGHEKELLSNKVSNNGGMNKISKEKLHSNGIDLL